MNQFVDINKTMIEIEDTSANFSANFVKLQNLINRLISEVKTELAKKVDLQLSLPIIEFVEMCDLVSRGYLCTLLRDDPSSVAGFLWKRANAVWIKPKQFFEWYAKNAHSNKARREAVEWIKRWSC